MKKSIQILIGILVICNIIASIKYYRLKNEAIDIAEKFSTIQIKEERISQKLKTYTMYQQALEGICIPAIQIQNSQKEINFLSELKLHDDEPTLCFRFKDTHCDACVQQAVRILNEISSFIPNKIILLSGYKNFTHFTAFESCQKEEITTYNIKDIPEWEIESLDQSDFFVCHNGRIHNIFIPIKEDDSYTIDYIHTLLHKYWNLCNDSEHSTKRNL